MHLLKLATLKVWHCIYCTVVISTSAVMIVGTAISNQATRVDEFIYARLQARDDLPKLFSKQQITDLETKGYFEMKEKQRESTRR